MRHYIGLIVLLVIGLITVIQPVITYADDVGISNNFTGNDSQFLFLMNQYWIPDIYEIKGRIDGSITYDIPEMLNLSVDYAKIRLLKNLNETKSYEISPDLVDLRSAYDRMVKSEMNDISTLPLLNRSAPGFADQVSKATARFSLYGSWFEYQMMQRYNKGNRTYPSIAVVPSDEFFSIMSNLT
jgi:hypothetical protein